MESKTESDTIAAPRRTVEWSKQRADALVHVAEASLVGEGSCHGARAQLSVHVDAEVLADVSAPGRCELEDGAAIAADSMRRLSCDADVLAIVHGEDGEPLGPGRRSRKVTSRLRRALWQRDQGCVFPGCSCKQYLHAHHVQHWAEGGPTELDNLVMLCRYHHRLVHEGGFSIDTQASDPRFFSPAGERVVPSRGVPAVTGDPVSLWHSLHDSSINALTTMPDWDGEHPDYQEMLQPLFDRDRRMST